MRLSASLFVFLVAAINLETIPPDDLARYGPQVRH